MSDVMTDKRACDALAEAKQAQQQTASGTKVILSLSVLEGLIAELERLRRLDNVQAIVKRNEAQV